MRKPTIAKNYADALFELGERSGETERYAQLMNGFGAVLTEEPEIRVVLESPRVPKEKKLAILQNVFASLAPVEFTRFLHAVVRRGRHGLFPDIAEQYSQLVDEKLGRVRVAVTLAREPDDKLVATIRDQLSAAIGKAVIPTFYTKEEILGGVILRVGDRIMDGSLRRKMKALRKRLLTA